ncbi:MAG: hypothetical protein K2X48_05610 [Chitinophagaceae bacterium]|nr:hypothetical protein [Chitinophagaceae bacterium]
MKLLSIYLTIGFFLVSCQKNETVQTKQEVPFDNKVTTAKMVEITNNQTKVLKEKIASLVASNARMSSVEYDNFVRENIEQYCNSLVAAEPTYVFNDNFQVNVLDTENWDNQPNVYSGDALTLLPQPILSRFDALADDLEAFENNPIYDNEVNLENGATQIETILQNHINTINLDPNLHFVDKQGISDALNAAKQLVRPELDYFKTLATGAISLGQDISEWRRRTFFGKLIRAVARVAITVVAVAVVTAVLIKGAVLIAPMSKFAVKVGVKGFGKSVFTGVGKTVTKKITGLPTLSYTGKFVSPGALYFGGIAGVVKASTKWDEDMSMKYWYKEFDFKFKGKP